MRSPVELWGVGLALSVVLALGLIQAGVNIGGELHRFVGAMLHLFGLPL